MFAKASTITPIKALIILSLAIITSQNANAVGGVSGGGGNVMTPVDQEFNQSPEKVEHLIVSSQDLLRKYIQYKKTQFSEALPVNSKEYEIYSKLLQPVSNQSSRIEQVWQRSKLKISEHKPCYTSDKIEVDGSSYSPSGAQVCISAYRIAQKVHYNHVEVQAAALIMHELGELSGLNDDEAVLIQEKAISEITAQ